MASILNHQTKENQVETNDDDDDNIYDNLCFNSKLIIGMNNYQRPNKESIDATPIKFSIDMTTAPKNLLQQYLNTDLLDELENDDKGEVKLKQDMIKEENGKFEQVNQMNMNMNIQMQMDNVKEVNDGKGDLTQGNLNNLGRNKFDVSQRVKNNSTMVKKKKPFEIREGDWTCFDCHNLNFAFRTKCNRCGLFKEISNQKCEEYRNAFMTRMNKGNNYFMK